MRPTTSLVADVTDEQPPQQVPDAGLRPAGGFQLSVKKPRNLVTDMFDLPPWARDIEVTVQDPDNSDHSLRITGLQLCEPEGLVRLLVERLGSRK